QHPQFFMPGDQGVLNYVLNQKAAIDGLRVDRRNILRWPGRSMEGLNAESVSKRQAVSRIVHWAGMKKPRHRDMIGADLLAFFEKTYYQPFPAGAWRRMVAGCWDTLLGWLRGLRVRFRLAWHRIIAIAIRETKHSG